MANVQTNTPYQITVLSDKGYIKFTAARRYNSATYKGHTEFGFMGWEIITYKLINGVWTRMRFDGYPGTIGSKKGVIEFLATRPIFLQAYNELKK